MLPTLFLIWVTCWLVFHYGLQALDWTQMTVKWGCSCVCLSCCLQTPVKFTSSHAGLIWANIAVYVAVVDCVLVWQHVWSRCHPTESGISKPIYWFSQYIWTWLRLVICSSTCRDGEKWKNTVFHEYGVKAEQVDNRDTGSVPAEGLGSCILSEIFHDGN